MRKSLPVTLVLTLSCLLAAACQTTPPAARSQPPAKPAQQTQSQGPAVQPHEPASQETQTAAQEQQPAAQPRQQQSAQPATPSTRRPGGGAAASQLTRLGSSAASGVGGLIRRVETLLGIKREPAGRPAPVAAPAAGVRGARPVPPDLVAVIVTGAIILVGSCLTLAAIIAGRRRG
jgi:outer membrane biosynthesis protein TonB